MTQKLVYSSYSDPPGRIEVYIEDGDFTTEMLSFMDDHGVKWALVDSQSVSSAKFFFGGKPDTTSHIKRFDK